MGCDIHGHLELKINGKWEHYNTLSINRDYFLFSKMANVRNDFDIIPISNPKGLPNDASGITLLDYNNYKDYIHSMSWLNNNEIKELKKWINAWNNNATSDDKIYTYFDTIEDLDINKDNILEDIRIVFWFDN